VSDALDTIDALARLACDRLVELDEAGLLNDLDESALHWVRTYAEHRRKWKQEHGVAS
jgi:hypothetical protein